MKKKINVMQVTFGMGIGGMERVIQSLCRGIDKNKYTIRVFCLNLKGGFGEELEKDGIEVIYSPRQSRLDRYLRAWEIAKAIKQYKIDVLHAHHTPAFLDAFLASRLAKVPAFINTDHCKKYPAPKGFMLAERMAAIFADKIVAVSNHTKQDLIDFEHISPSKIDVIYNGIDFPKYDGSCGIRAMKKELGVAEDERVIGCVSRLDEQKGYDLFLDTAALIIKKVPNTRFIIVGGGVKENELKERSRNLGINNRITFTGWRLDANRILQLFDLFLLTSNFEGMPIVLLEAMASGKPIVATAVGGIPEVVQHGETGFVVKSRNAKEVAQYALRIINDMELSAKIKKNSISAYNAKFRAKPMIDAYEHLYESTLARKGINLKC